MVASICRIQIDRTGALHGGVSAPGRARVSAERLISDRASIGSGDRLLIGEGISGILGDRILRCGRASCFILSGGCLGPPQRVRSMA
jgi:hypothetical protein